MSLKGNRVAGRPQSRYVVTHVMGTSHTSAVERLDAEFVVLHRLLEDDESLEGTHEMVHTLVGGEAIDRIPAIRA